MNESELSQQIKNSDASSYNPLADHFDFFSQIVTKPIVPELLNIAELTENQNLLDIGTGTGIVANYASELLGSKNNVIGIDYTIGMLKAAVKKRPSTNPPHFIQMDAEALAFSNNSIDNITSLYVLRHLPNPQVALTEMHRVLKPGANLIIGVGSGVSLFSLKVFSAAVRQAWIKYETFKGRYAHACNLIDQIVTEMIPNSKTHQNHHHSTENTFENADLLKWLKAHGFTNIKTKWINNQFKFDSIEEFWSLQSTFSSYARKSLMSATKEQYAAVHQEFTSRCNKVKSNGGLLEYQTGTLIIKAVKA